MRKHFKPEGEKPLAEWTNPKAGLFFWLVLLLAFLVRVRCSFGANRFKLNLPDEDSAQLIQTKALAKGVLAVPGTMFFPSGRRTAYVRTAFSVLDVELADEALRRLAGVVREVVEEGSTAESLVISTKTKAQQNYQRVLSNIPSSSSLNALTRPFYPRIIFDIIVLTAVLIICTALS